jgi:soluble lytic murein transglycosylase-like protein
VRKAAMTTVALAVAVAVLAALVLVVVQSSGFGLLRRAVPTEYRGVVIAAARACDGVSAPVLAAQIDAESGWNPRAVSSQGARGIAQFMPETWASHGKDAPRPFSGDGKADVWNPYDAIYSAARYNCKLRRMLERVPGQPIRNVLAAYNAGPYAVLDYAGVPPFAETQEYVSRILRAAEDFAVSRHGKRARWTLAIAGDIRR